MTERDGALREVRQLVFTRSWWHQSPRDFV
jgi:hypothetical protein